MKKLNSLFNLVFLLIMFMIIFDVAGLSAILTVILLVSIFFVVRKFDIKYFPIILFVISFIVRVAFNLIVDTRPISDFAVLYNASKNVMDNNFSFMGNDYFTLWSYQIGFILYQSLLLKIFNSLFFLKIVNSILAALNCVFIYLIGAEITEKKNAQIASLIYSFMAASVMYTGVLSNQFIASFLIYLGIYILINKRINFNIFLKYLVVGVLLSVSNVLRPEAIIPLCSIIGFLILRMKKENWKDNLKKILIISSSFVILSVIFNQILILTGISKYGLANNAPYWKFVVGLNVDSKGNYNDKDLYLLGDKEASIEVIKNRIFSGPVVWMKLIFSKINSFWGTETLSWSVRHIWYEKFELFEFSILGEIFMILEKYDLFIKLFFYCCVFLGISAKVKKKILDDITLIFMIQVAITFAIYLLIEVQSRYVYNVQISIAILSAIGIGKIREWFDIIKASFKIGSEESVMIEDKSIKKMD